MPALEPPYAPIRHASRLVEGATFALDAQAMRGLAFRAINVKEAFTIVDASGAFFRASLKSASAEGGEAVAYEKMPSSTESPARITLVCAVLGRQRMILVTQKATELGCVRIVPVLSENSVRPHDLEKEKPWAWPGQALKGARQCRRASVPEVQSTQPLAAAMASPFWRAAPLRFVLDDRSPPRADPFPLSNAPVEERDVVLVVGPEGGFSDRERADLVAADAVPLALGARVLRAETAVFAGLAVLQHRLGDLRVT
jgi:16S rRNA (uracil1498-N3)-methyltransferase